MTQKIGAGLLSCADKIWETADTLRGAGIKASDWPAYMMPFFALMMLESRLRRFRQSRIDEFKKETDSDFKFEDAAHLEWLEYSAKAANKGFHKELLLHGKGLAESCLVPGGNFLNRLISHLDQYDPDTKRLLGIGYAQGQAKFLDMQGKASDLFSRDNCPLYPFAKKWASIDLTSFDNSEITTIEEHIKRKWADISAETAGEQYTPSDVIDLATALIVELRSEGKGGAGIADVYDMASGGGNFLFATEDALRDAFPELSVRTRGQELNDALYALAAIEARFRQDARIEWGNRVRIALSTPLLFEYEDVLKRNQAVLSLSDAEVDVVLDNLCARADFQAVYFLWRPCLPDAKDDMVLELAVAAQVPRIVSFNAKDFVPASRFGIEVLTPKILLEELQ